MKRFLCAFALTTVASQVFAHTPLCDCFDNGDDTISCEGGFSDGSSAAGMAVRVYDDRGKILIDTVMETDSSISFPRPAVESYTVVFDAGEGHLVTVYSDDIE